MSFRLLIPSLALAMLSGCMVNRSQSTIDDERTGYAITKDQAREISKSSLAAYISADYINPSPADSLTASGYIRAGLDTQTINVTALPISGRTSKGKPVSGYGFLVTDRGTIGYDPAPKNIFALVKKQAASQGAPFTVSTNPD